MYQVPEQPCVYLRQVDGDDINEAVVLFSTEKGRITQIHMTAIPVPSTVFHTGEIPRKEFVTNHRDPASFIDRARAALLAHACGDRFGAPLEFISGPSVRTRPVQLGNWTDDTHMSLYLGEAILEHGPGPLRIERFGDALGEAFVRWMHDPLTPSTAPGNTCLAGVANFERDRDWRTSGIASSDGCGAVMRIVPLALAFHGEELLEAARVSARITHAHPNAEEAAMAGAWLVREILDTNRWGSGLVKEAVRALKGRWSRGGHIADSLRAALAWVNRGEDWLDESMIPPGDGGWRSGSALGLAVAAALRWPDDLGIAVEKAARIQGDSDSVACLTGALLGAALGTGAIPCDWLETLPRRRDIADLADQLLRLRTATPATPSPTRPLVVIADLHGHLDLFEQILETIDRYDPQARIVTIGDYVDNGPQIPKLLDRLIDLKAERADRFFPILGNHDLALLRALGWPGDASDAEWYDHWRRRYWNAGVGTPEAYGAHDLGSFERSFPLAHYRFLASLPWYYEDGQYLCVHAGLHPGPIEPQRIELERKAMPPERFFLPDALREKALATVDDPSWERIVVSGHTHLASQAVLFGKRRVAVSATSDHGGGLLAVALPERKCWRASSGGVLEVAIQP
jgi:ADP-ribosylglycohydrolase